MGLLISVNKVKKATKTDIDECMFVVVEDDFPTWTDKFKTPHRFKEFDWDAYSKKVGVNYVHDWKCIGESYTKNGDFFEMKNIFSNKKVKISMDDIPTKYSNTEYTILGYEFIDMVSKGMNQQFYNDYEDDKIDTYVWSKNQLTDYMNKYCENDKSKKVFQEKIIDKFVEGEMFVEFD